MQAARAQLRGERGVRPHGTHDVGPLVLQLEVVGTVLAGKLAGVTDGLVADAKILAVLLVPDGTQVGSEARTTAYGRIEPRSRDMGRAPRE